jgi:hypothetical protein
VRLVVDSEIGGEYVDYSKKPPVQPAQHAYRLGFESVRLAIPLSPAKAQDCLGLDVNGSCIGLQAPGIITATTRITTTGIAITTATAITDIRRMATRITGGRKRPNRRRA